MIGSLTEITARRLTTPHICSPLWAQIKVPLIWNSLTMAATTTTTAAAATTADSCRDDYPSASWEMPAQNRNATTKLQIKDIYTRLMRKLLNYLPL